MHLVCNEYHFLASMAPPEGHVGVCADTTGGVQPYNHSDAAHRLVTHNVARLQ